MAQGTVFFKLKDGEVKKMKHEDDVHDMFPGFIFPKKKSS